MKQSGSLTKRVVVTILLGGLALIAGLCIYSYMKMAEISTSYDSEEAARIVSMIGSRIENEQQTIARAAENAARFSALSSHWVLYSTSLEAARLDNHLITILRASPQLVAVGVMLDPRVYERSLDEAMHAPFAVRNGDTIQIVDMAEDPDGYVSSDAFVKGTASKAAAWCDPTPYISTLVTSCASYILPTEKGVFVCEVSPEWIENIAGGAVSTGGSLVIKSGSGRKIYSIGDDGRGDASAEQFKMDKLGWTAEVKVSPKGIVSPLISSVTTMAAVGCVILVLTAIAASFSTGAYSASIRGITERLQTASADTSEDLAILDRKPAGDDIVELAHSIENMRIEISKVFAGEERELLNAERIKNETDTASVVRGQFFRNPDMSGERFDVSARLVDNGSAMGDFYDIVRTDIGNIYVILGGIDGADMTAAVSVPSILSFVRSVIMKSPEPSVALAQINELLNEFSSATSGAGRHVSMIIAAFYPTTGTCSIAAAGSFTHYVIRGASPEDIEIPIAASLCDSEADYSSVVINMGFGDTLMLATRGVHGDDSDRGKLPTLAALALQSEGKTSEAVSAMKLKGNGVILLLQYSKKGA